MVIPSPTRKRPRPILVNSGLTWIGWMVSGRCAEGVSADQGQDRQGPVHWVRHHQGCDGWCRAPAEGTASVRRQHRHVPMNELALITQVKGQETKDDFNSEFAEQQLQDAGYQMRIALFQALSSIIWDSTLTRDEKISATDVTIQQFADAYM